MPYLGHLPGFHSAGLTVAQSFKAVQGAELTPQSLPGVTMEMLTRHGHRVMGNV